jgi:hypothetical protein
MTSLDKIVRSFLLGRGYSIHYYLQCLLFARDCLRELHFDDLHCVSYKAIVPDAYNELHLPDDCMDIVSVGFPVGQKMRPLVQDNGLNPIPYYDNSGTRITVSQATNTTTTNTISNSYNGWAYNSFDDYGSYLGRNFGYRPEYTDTYRFIPERCVVKVNEALTFDVAIIQYISDGSCCDSATHVDPYAIATIRAYIEWYFDYRGEAKTAGEFKFNKQRQILRGRKSDITPDGIKRALQLSYSK